ncbi:MAG: hypothetical protein V4671_31345 [Armatimonadota bacterium]
MKQLIEKLIATNFADLEGLQISGTVPVKQELMNEVLAQVLKGEMSSSPAGATVAEPGAARSSGPRLNPKDLLKLITHAEVQAHEGELRLVFEIRR